MIKEKYIITMTTIYNHISYSAHYHILSIFLHIYLYKQDRIFNIFKTVILILNFDHIESISPCRTPYEVVNCINILQYGFKV